MLISDNYRQLNETLHSEQAFGISGYKWGGAIAWLAHHHQITHILDYGAGQQTLKKSLESNPAIRVDCYDPAIPALATQPQPTEMVTCTDVLEHIEPEHLDAVLDDIQRIAFRNVFLVIPTGPAAKFLADGRNAHLIQKPLAWWLPKIMQRFDIITINQMTNDIVIFASKKTNLKSKIQAAFFEITKEHIDHKIMSASFDGLYWHFSIKKKISLLRTISRILSVIFLGKKLGITKKIKRENDYKLCLTYY